MRVTQQTIAEAAGVSTTTVSFVLSGRAAQMKLNARTVRRVQQVAERLGFSANYHARSLAMGQSHTLGLVIPDDGQTLLHRFWAPVIGGVGTRARERGYDLLLIGDRPDGGAAGSAARFIEQRRIDGAILLPLGKLDAVTWPVGSVVVGLNRSVAGHPQVTLDAASGIAAALRHLQELGHQRVLYLGRRTGQSIVSADRVQAFEAGARGLKLTPRVHLVEFEDDGEQGVDWYITRYRAAIQADFRLPAGVTAVLCYNDNMGLALCSVLAEQGVRVPADVSVIGFDDLSAACAIPPLTTISHMLSEMGATAVDCALDRIEARGKKRRTGESNIIIKPRLIIRASTGPAAKG